MEYTRSQCARLFGISMDGLRYLESSGLIQPAKGPDNRRIYSPEQIMVMLDYRKLRSLGLSNEELVGWYAGEHAIPHRQIYGNTLEKLTAEREELSRRIDYIKGLSEILNGIERKMDTVTIGERPERQFVFFDEMDPEFTARIMREGLPYLNYGYWIAQEDLRSREKIRVRFAIDVCMLKAMRPQLYRDAMEQVPVHCCPAGLKVYCFKTCRHLEDISAADFDPLFRYAEEHRYRITGDMFGGIIGPNVRFSDRESGFILTQTLMAE